jgi:hypothetical protein
VRIRFWCGLDTRIYGISNSRWTKSTTAVNVLCVRFFLCRVYPFVALTVEELVTRLSDLDPRFTESVL